MAEFNFIIRTPSLWPGDEFLFFPGEETTVIWLDPGELMGICECGHAEEKHHEPIEGSSCDSDMSCKLCACEQLRIVRHIVLKSVTMFDLLVKAGIFPSKGQARNAWPSLKQKFGLPGDGEVPEGWTDLEGIGKLKHRISILKPRPMEKYVGGIDRDGVITTA